MMIYSSISMNRPDSLTLKLNAVTHVRKTIRARLIAECNLILWMKIRDGKLLIVKNRFWVKSSKATVEIFHLKLGIQKVVWIPWLLSRRLKEKVFRCLMDTNWGLSSSIMRQRYCTTCVTADSTTNAQIVKTTNSNVDVWAIKIWYHTLYKFQNLLLIVTAITARSTYRVLIVGSLSLATLQRIVIMFIAFFFSNC